MAGVVDGEVPTIIKVTNRFEGLTVGKKWSQPKGSPSRLLTGEQVEFGVYEDPRSYRIAQSAV